MAFLQIFLKLTLLTVSFPCCSAHDNDVKEANKQRGQAGPQPAQLSVFQTASQPSRAVHFQQPQYLHQTHQTSLQYRHPVSEQPSCQQIVSTTHTSSYTLPTCPAGFQTSVQGLGHVQTGVGMSLAIPVEVKPCLNVSYNRSYQINEHYPCITPCFERWFYEKVRLVTQTVCDSKLWGKLFVNFSSKGKGSKWHQNSSDTSTRKTEYPFQCTMNIWED